MAKKLDYLTLREFYAHMESCADCKGEMTINFLVTDGLKKLENGDAYDLHKEWGNRLLETRRKLKRNESVIQAGFWMEILAVGIIAGIVLARVISYVMQIPVAISVPAILVAIIFSTLVGVIFGLLPSVRASKLNPIDALRYE